MLPWTAVEREQDEPVESASTSSEAESEDSIESSDAELDGQPALQRANRLEVDQATSNF